MSDAVMLKSAKSMDTKVEDISKPKSLIFLLYARS